MKPIKQKIENATDKDICQAILAAQEAQEYMEITGRHGNVNNTAPIQTQPTRCKVLHADSLIKC